MRDRERESGKGTVRYFIIVMQERFFSSKFQTDFSNVLIAGGEKMCQNGNDFSVFSV